MSELGAYGLRLPGFPGSDWLRTVPTEWPHWTFDTDSSPLIKRPPQKLDNSEAILNTQPRGYVRIDRSRSTTTVAQGKIPSRDAFAHPILASTALVVSEWAKKLVFHGGMFLDQDGFAWGVLGNRGDGKSSFLGWCVVNGIEVLADDLVVTDGVSVVCGPRCVDLREGAAAYFRLGTDIGVVGTRRRWRVQVPDRRASAPFRGWVTLAWGAETIIRGLVAQERAAVLAANRGINVGQNHPIPWLKALSAPALQFKRPQDWTSIDKSMATLMEAVSKVGSDMLKSQVIS
ncbi:hypothetical protein ACNHUS_07035 [Actinomycetes bacterium M1A6_2h]